MGCPLHRLESATVNLITHNSLATEDLSKEIETRVVGYTKSVLQAAGIEWEKSTALQRHVGFFGNISNGEIDEKSMVVGLTAIGIGQKQACLIAHKFVKTLAEKEGQTKVTVDKIHFGLRTSATNIYKREGADFDEAIFNKVIENQPMITKEYFNKVIKEDAARDKPELKEALSHPLATFQWFFDAKLAAPGEAKTMFELAADIQKEDPVTHKAISAFSIERFKLFFINTSQIFEELSVKNLANRQIIKV